MPVRCVHRLGSAGMGVRCALALCHSGAHQEDIQAQGRVWPCVVLPCGHSDACVAGEGLTHWCAACEAVAGGVLRGVVGLRLRVQREAAPYPGGAGRLLAP
jgi:hypothetical protein